MVRALNIILLQRLSRIAAAMALPSATFPHMTTAQYYWNYAVESLQSFDVTKSILLETFPCRFVT